MSSETTRRIEIRLEQRGVTCVARLLDDRAPRTCAAVWESLPQGGDAFHGKYARNEIYTLVESFADPELGSASHGYGPERRPRPGARIVDLALFYERNNLLLNPDIGWVPGNVFATIESGLEEMARACQDMWLNGVAGERLTFDRAP
jgi:hypothetical protein